MAEYALKINSYLGCDTRIQVVKERSPKKETFQALPLDRNCENETGVNDDANPDKNTRQAKRGNRTQNRLSPHARKTLQRIGGAAQFRFNVSDALFLTGTFPGGSYAAQSAIASQAGWIVHRLKAWIHKIIGKNVGYYVWEFQKRGTLHLHYVVFIPNHYQRAYIEFEFRNEWIRLIKGASIRSLENLFIGNKGRDFFTEKELLQIYAQECYGNCSSYLSKYLTKKKTSKFPSPCRLWGCTKEARNLVAASLITLEIPTLLLRKAEDLAYKYDSYSNAPPEKRRYFRHRFSQGFTILLYDDLFREAIMPPEKEVIENRALVQCISRLLNKLSDSGCYEPMREMASQPLREGFFWCGLNPISLVSSVQPDDLKTNLWEIDSLVSLVPCRNRYHREDLRNLTRAALRCLDSR
jgi:hypothetical protein